MQLQLPSAKLKLVKLNCSKISSLTTATRVLQTGNKLVRACLSPLIPGEMIIPVTLTSQVQLKLTARSWPILTTNLPIWQLAMTSQVNLPNIEPHHLVPLHWKSVPRQSLTQGTITKPGVDMRSHLIPLPSRVTKLTTPI